MLFQLAWRNLWRNPRRTLITAASVFFAVILAVLMSSMQQGVWDNMIDNLVSLQTGHLRVEADDYRDEQVLDNGFPASDSMLKALSALEGVASAHPKLDGFVLASAGDQSRVGMVQGLDAMAFAHRANRLVAGSIPAGNPPTTRRVGRAVVGVELAEYLHQELGDTLVLLGQGYRGSVAAQLVVIDGLVDLGNPDLNRATVYLPLADAQRLFAAEGIWTGIVLEPDNRVALQDLAQHAAAVAGNGFVAPTWEDMLPEIKQAREADEGGGLMMLFILYMLIGFGILGTILMMTLERQYEFGVLVAVGMRRSKLGFLVLVEGFLVAMLGALGGLGASFPVIHYLARNPIPLQGALADAYVSYGFDPVFAFSTNTAIFTQQAIVVACIALVVSTYPLYRISRLEPVQAMRAG